MVNLDRLTAVTDELARVVEATPLPPGALDPTLATLVRAARIVGLDLEAVIRARAASSIRSLASQASADPERAEDVAAWASHLLAWLRDERDDPPPADIRL
jgi:hypothetical protein